MPEVKFTCWCIKECIALGINRGMIFNGTAHLDEYGIASFTVELTCGTLTWNQDLFANYFRIFV